MNRNDYGKLDLKIGMIGVNDGHVGQVSGNHNCVNDAPKHQQIVLNHHHHHHGHNPSHSGVERPLSPDSSSKYGLKWLPDTRLPGDYAPQKYSQLVAFYIQSVMGNSSFDFYLNSNNNSCGTDHRDSLNVADRRTRNIFFFLLLNLSFTGVETLYGWWSNSLV
jgi:hypothetical protein